MNDIDFAEYHELLLAMPLWRGFTPAELEQLLRHCNARVIQFDDDIVFRNGKHPGQALFCIVLHGTMTLQQDDWLGNRNILQRLHPGEFFSGSMALGAHGFYEETYAEFRGDGEVLLMDYAHMLRPCGQNCAAHTRLLQNMVTSLVGAQTALLLQIETLSRRTTREKTLCFLGERAVQTDSRKFEIDYNRQEMADVLGVDRSGLSSELSRMQAEGLLRFRGNAFELLECATCA